MMSAQESINEMKKKAKDNTYSDNMRKIIEAVDVTAGNYRRRVIGLRDREREGSDMWHVYNLLRFWVRVSPKTSDKVDEFWKEFEPTYDYFYLQCAIGNRVRSRFMADAVRRMSFILLAPGATDVHKKLLLEKLTELKERMRTAVSQQELERAISSLETYFEMKQKQKQQISSAAASKTSNSSNNIVLPAIPPPYCFGDSSLVQRAERSQLIFHNNPLLNVKIGESQQDYSEIKERINLSRQVKKQD